jgi:hypothetical protein
MPLNVTGNFNVTSVVSETITAGLGTSTLQANVSYQAQWAAGSGANAINQSITKTGTLAISTPLTLVLSAITDDLGRTIAFTKVRELLIKNRGTADLTVGAAATNPWTAPFGGVTTAKTTIKPGGVFALAAPDVNGYAVGVGTSEQLKLDPGATACLYELVLKGE